jgi:O-acetyl-ADP-ribose deacetylase (regulator of RNase III)
MKTFIELNNCLIELVCGDITLVKVDAVVNAANSALSGGGGVDGAIHRVGGHEISQECRKLGGCRTGDAKITTGGKLAARFVIHAVGPIYKGGHKGEPELLASAYKRSLEVARENNLSSIAFPSLSTGAYGYPIGEASKIALKTIIKDIKKYNKLQLVKMVLYTDKDLEIYKRSLEKIAKFNEG